MYCIKCGSKNMEENKFCFNCGTELRKQEMIEIKYLKIKTYLIPAIISTTMCCMPFGIVSIIYAVKTSGFIEEGNILKAKEVSKKAKKWCILSFVTGFIWLFLCLYLAVMDV